MRAQKLERGGLTAIVGWILTFVGIIGAGAAWAERSWFIQWVDNTHLSLPEYAVPQDWILLFASAVTAAAGIFLIGLSREERRREQELQVDPLSFPPFRRPTWHLAVPVALVVAIGLALPGLFLIPQATTVSLDFPVGVCPGSSAYSVTIPSGAIFTYSWHSSDGSIVSSVNAPDGPIVVSSTNSGSEFADSSFGYSSVTGDGSPINFSACNDPGTGGTGVQIDLSGMYYQFG